MTDMILFHHALGLTEGVEAFADALRAAGHRVTVPDLYDGATFATIEDGVAHAEHIGMDEIIDRGVAVAQNLPENMVYAGFSLGVLPAQKLAQTRSGALGALLYHEGLAASTFGDSWPDQVALQVHLTEHDEWSELDVARELVDGAADGELFLYRGSAHLFTDQSFTEYDPDATKLVLQRSIAFLSRWT
ncbi:MAG: dienelactone hydrolase family protein [Acidimicrobiia bacterium]